MGCSPQGRKEWDTTERLHFQSYQSGRPVRKNGSSLEVGLGIIVRRSAHLWDSLQSWLSICVTFRSPLLEKKKRFLKPDLLWESQFQPLGREDPLEKGMATHSSILSWRIPWTRVIVHKVAKS